MFDTDRNISIKLRCFHISSVFGGVFIVVTVFVFFVSCLYIFGRFTRTLFYTFLNIKKSSSILHFMYVGKAYTLYTKSDKQFCCIIVGFKTIFYIKVSSEFRFTYFLYVKNILKDI